MKLPYFFLFTLFLAFTTVIACNDKKADTTTEQTTLSPEEGVMISDPEASASTASAGSEPHYKCPKNCVGGGGAAQGKCPVCGTDLVHNQAFHAQAAAPGSSPSAPIVVDPVTSTNPTTTTTTTTTNPTTMQPPTAQNAKGVFHYTCPKGCAGGAAAAGKCATCGGDLAHNQAFHAN